MATFPSENVSSVETGGVLGIPIEGMCISMACLWT